jgi:hypothetical protein
MQETHEKGIASRRYKPASGCLPLGHGRVTGVRSEKSGLYIVFVCFAHFVVCAAASVCSASTSQNYTASDVLTAMGVPAEQIKGALRLSWCHERARLQLPRARSSPDARGAVGGGGGTDQGVGVRRSSKDQTPNSREGPSPNTQEAATPRRLALPKLDGFSCERGAHAPSRVPTGALARRSAPADGALPPGR